MRRSTRVTTQAAEENTSAHSEKGLLVVDQNRGALVALRDELEQQLRSGLRQRDEAQLVNGQQLVVGELFLQPRRFEFVKELLTSPALGTS